MLTIKLKSPEKTLDVVKELVYRLWEACGVPAGMGFLQDRGPGVSKEAVFEQAVGSRDYVVSFNKPGEIYMDYVFGRCIKTNIEYNEKEGKISISPDEPKPTYQDWGRKYRSANEVVKEVLANVGTDILQMV